MPDSFRLDGAASGPLEGLTFAAKDLYDVKGHVTSFGSPYWAATHAPAAFTAPAVQVLLDAGARLVGKAQLNQLAYSFNGRNECYGTPVNPACPDRIPGGSSSGSAVAVAEGSADIALGSDTGGSVRVPASYCGILGLRPTHGRVSLVGVCPLAPSYDTGGFFAKDLAVLQKAAAVLLEPSMHRRIKFTRLLIAGDAFAIADADAREALLQALTAPALRERYGDLVQVGLGDVKTGSLTDWADAQRRSANYEIWQELGPWVEQHRPPFGQDVAPQLSMASQITAEEAEAATVQRRAIAARMDELLGDGTAVLLPATTSAAPPLSLAPDELNPIWKRVIKLTAPAGLAGLPQVSLPVAKVDSCPLGLGLMGPRGSDEDLLRLAADLMELLRA
ncbi:hypothetical protein WJX81_003594 [Elliptochloris bilobata]|uniref:Amidase domain-containing protein n=1 Tax=Elliptochloris bilobata TaxID=381761 RepID=A0AAW1QXD2_9CHLO